MSRTQNGSLGPAPGKIDADSSLWHRTGPPACPRRSEHFTDGVGLGELLRECWWYGATGSFLGSFLGSRGVTAETLDLTGRAGLLHPSSWLSTAAGQPLCPCQFSISTACSLWTLCSPAGYGVNIGLLAPRESGHPARPFIHSLIHSLIPLGILC